MPRMRHSQAGHPRLASLIVAYILPVCALLAPWHPSAGIQAMIHGDETRNNKAAAMFGMEPAFPFLNRELLSFLMSVRGEVKTRHGVPKAILRHAMRGILPDAIVDRKWKADFTHLVNAGVEQDYEQMVDRLSADAAVASWGFVKPQVLNRELSRLRNHIAGADALNSWMLSDLFALEIWLSIFFEGQKAAA